ncbi:class I adenylate-forming enzyme family protein [Nocardia sp. CY41]|uniref:class I adenylate-forming enzyme family protein n=1 Tax=Nocardia sp. CY41 TaxID=2608686 RepID=UPI001358CCDF|nr:AMP-binding protein [Nocardia sp. CY41]
MTLSTLPDRRADAAPHAPAIADDRIELNNSEFLAAVQRAASALRAVGVTSGDVVATMLPGAVDLVVSLFATWRLGAAAAVIDPMVNDAEAGRRISDAGSTVVIATTRPAGVDPSVPVVPLAATGRDVVDPARPDAEELALITYCGDDREMLDHRHLTAMCRFVIEVFALTEADHSLSTLPMRQICGIWLGALSPLAVGGRATMVGHLDPWSFLDRIERFRPTYSSAVPGLYAALTELPGRMRADTTSVRFALCCAAPARIELRTRFQHRYGIPIVNGHGLSEVVARAHALRSPAVTEHEPSSTYVAPQ